MRKNNIIEPAQASEPEIEPEPEPESIPAPYPQWDDIPEYPRPEIRQTPPLHRSHVIQLTQTKHSPYTTKPITITIGQCSYTVPEYFLRPYPAFELNQWTRIFNLSDIHPDVGHTFIHYLYTSTYETTKSYDDASTDPDLSPRAFEFQRSMHTYLAARRYGITGLTDLAKTYIRVFDIDVSTLYILTVAREISSSLPSDEVWFWEYVREKLAIAFEDDEAGLRGDIAHYGVGRDPFDAFLVSAVLDIYASALPGKANGHVHVHAHSHADESVGTASHSEADVSDDEQTVDEWDSDPGKPIEVVVYEDEDEDPHAIDGPVSETPLDTIVEAEAEAEAAAEAEAIPELDTARSPDQVAISPSPPPASPPADEAYDPWDHWGRSNGAYTGPATGLPARLTTLVEEQSEPSVEPVPVEDSIRPTDEFDLGFNVPRKKKKRGKYYDIAPADEHPEPVIEEPPLEIEPEPEPEPGIPLPEPAVPAPAAPVETPVGNGWGGFKNQDFRFYSAAQPVATAE